jgi:hypothetical protein
VDECTALASGKAVLLGAGQQVEISFEGDEDLPYVVVDAIKYIPRGSVVGRCGLTLRWPHVYPASNALEFST